MTPRGDLGGWGACAAFTSSVKPMSQIVSHFPQMYVCYKLRTTGGVSMLTHHLNIVGGVCGILSTLTAVGFGECTFVKDRSTAASFSVTCI